MIYKSKHQAHQGASAICKKLGREWTVDVRVGSLGWIGNATNGIIAVYRETSTYTAFYHKRSIMVGEGITPQQAVIDLVQQWAKHAGEIVGHYERMLRLLE